MLGSVVFQEFHSQAKFSFTRPESPKMGANASSSSFLGAPPPRPTISPMRLSVELQRKLGHGARLNIKIVLRGDVQTGKSSLLRRLQGLSHVPEMKASSELTVGTIDWHCEGSPDVVKVEAWDVVDADLCRRPSTVTPTLKHSHSCESGSSAGPTIDVWRGTDAAIVLFDPRKRWTFVYALRLLSEAPAHVPVLLASNFADCTVAFEEEAYESVGGDGGASSSSQLVAWAEVEQAAHDEAKRSGRLIVAVRTSMVDCVGLPTMHTFLQLPYFRAKQLALAAAQREAASKLSHAEAAVRALAAGLEPPPSFDALGSARSVPATALIGAADTRVSARIELSLEEAPQTPAGGFGGFGPLPIHRHSAIPAAAPRLEPPPGTTPAQCAPSTARISGAALPIAPNTTSTPSRLPGLDIGIADSFFDGVDATPAAASRSAATEGLGGSGVQGGGGRGSLTMAPVQRQEAKGDDDEEEDLLPLLDDPDAD